jgi:hypothetical protein
MEHIQMTAQKSNLNSTVKKKFVIGARLQQRLSKEDRELLQNLKPSKKMQELVDKLPLLKIIDGATCGL